MTANTDNQQETVHLGFSAEWEHRYCESTHLSIWPWSDLVSYVCRYAIPAESYNNVLELGCGAGANIPFFLSRKFNYYAIEGSETIVGSLKERFPELSERIINDDFTKRINFDIEFDLVVDRSSLTHNDTLSIKNALSSINKSIRHGGMFIGIDWFAKDHPDSQKGNAVDSNTRTDIDSASFFKTGNVHFSDKDHILDIFSNAGFNINFLEHKKHAILVNNYPGNATMLRAYNFVAVKP